MTTVDTQWHPRSEPTPKGVLIWVTDGKDDVWLLKGDGFPFDLRASLCNFWAIASYPKLPDGTDPPTVNGEPT